MAPVTPPMSPRPISPSLPSFAVSSLSSAREASERTPLIDRKALSTSRPATPTRFDSVTERTRLLLSVSYASVSGILSGMCLIFAKSGVELLLLTIGGKNQFWRWEAWVLLLGLAVFALLQLWYLQKSLVFADPTIICPCMLQPILRYQANTYSLPYQQWPSAFTICHRLSTGLFTSINSHSSLLFTYGSFLLGWSCS